MINSLNVDQTSEDIHSFTDATVLFRMVERLPHASGNFKANDPYISKLAVILIIRSFCFYIA